MPSAGVGFPPFKKRITSGSCSMRAKKIIPVAWRYRPQEHPRGLEFDRHDTPGPRPGGSRPTETKSGHAPLFDLKLLRWPFAALALSCSSLSFLAKSSLFLATKSCSFFCRSRRRPLQCGCQRAVKPSSETFTGFCWFWKFTEEGDDAVFLEGADELVGKAMAGTQRSGKQST